MNILFVTRKFPPSVGGMELFAYEVYSAIKEKENVRLVKFGGPRLLSVPALPWLWLKASFILLTRPMDIVYIGDGLQAPFGVIVAKLFRKKSVVTVHGLDLTWPKRYYQLIVPPFVRKADKVICISQEVLNETIKCGIDENKTVLIPLGIKDNIYETISRSQARQKLSFSDDQIVLLSVGRLVKRKGIAWFIDDVLKELVAKYPNVILYLIGDGDDRTNIEKAVQENNLSESVTIAGKVSNEDRIAAYNGSDIFIMPNIKVHGDMEGFGLVLLEASSSALPVIAAGIEGIKDAVTDKENGLLVESGNKEQFIEELSKLIEDNVYRKKIGEKARAYTLENYRWDKVGDKFIEVFKSLVS